MVQRKENDNYKWGVQINSTSITVAISFAIKKELKILRQREEIAKIHFKIELVELRKEDWYLKVSI